MCLSFNLESIKIKVVFPKVSKTYEHILGGNIMIINLIRIQLGFRIPSLLNMVLIWRSDWRIIVIFIILQGQFAKYCVPRALIFMLAQKLVLFNSNLCLFICLCFSIIFCWLLNQIDVNFCLRWVFFWFQFKSTLQSLFRNGFKGV